MEKTEIKNEELHQIIRNCLKLDSFAYSRYGDFSKMAPESDKALWTEMASDEKSHVDFWRKCLERNKNFDLPDIFENNKEISGQLELLVAEFKNSELPKTYDRRACFRTALQIESHLLMPEFFAMLNFFSSEENNIAKRYGEHLERLLIWVSKSDEFSDFRFFTENIIHLYRKNLAQAIESIKDPLTGALNRRGFWERAIPLLSISERDGKGIGIIMLDVDNFKKVNDSFGHPAGDEVLKNLASVIAQSVRKYDIPSRYGGEEFIILSASDNSEHLFALAERIREKIKETIKTPDSKPVTASLGCKFQNKASNTRIFLNETIAEADANLYIAKKTGKDKTTIS